MLDLEKVAEDHAINSSYDLRSALKTSKLRLCSAGVVSKSSKPEVHVIEKIIEKHHHEQTLDEEKLMSIMRQIMRENKPQAPKQNDNQILDAVSALQKQIESLKLSKDNDAEDSINMPSIDPVKLAELQAKAIDKLTDDIETSNKKPSKRVILKNTKLNDLADELN